MTHGISHENSQDSFRLPVQHVGCFAVKCDSVTTSSDASTTNFLRLDGVFHNSLFLTSKFKRNIHLFRDSLICRHPGFLYLTGIFACCLSGIDHKFHNCLLDGSDTSLMLQLVQAEKYVKITCLNVMLSSIRFDAVELHNRGGPCTYRKDHYSTSPVASKPIEPVVKCLEAASVSSSDRDPVPYPLLTCQLLSSFSAYLQLP
jgi:hypothetical protein